MISTRSLLLLFSLASSLVSATTTVTSPSGGESITIGQPFEIKWDTDVPSAQIGLSVCWNGSLNCDPITSGRPNNGSFTWTPKKTLQPREDYTILLTVGATANTAADYPSSPLFGLVVASSSTSGPSSTSGTETSSTGGPAASTTGSGNQTGNPSPSDSGSSTNGTIIGAAVGAVAGVVILAVAGFIWMRKRNQKKLAEARRNLANDVEAGEKKKPNGSGSVNGAAAFAGDKKKRDSDEAFAPNGDKKNGSSGSSSDIAMAELPAVQQEVFEMAAVPAAGSSSGKGQHFFAMELDSREIPRPGTSTVKPDIDPASNVNSPAAVKPSADKSEGRGVSIDGTTVNSDTERPTSLGSIEQIKESSREGSQRDLTHQNGSAPRSNTPALSTPGEDSNGAGPSNRDSTPQIGSIPKLGGFDFDTAKF